MGLKLADQVHVGRDHAAHHHVAAARHRVAMQHDRFGPARHLDGAVGIAGIDDIRRVRPGAEGLLTRHEIKRGAAPEAIADPVRLGRDLPSVREEPLAALAGDPVPVKPRQHPEFGGVARHPPQVRRNGPAAPAPLPDRQFIASGQRAALMPAKRAQRIGRARAELHRNVDPARDRDIGPRARFQKAEGQPVPRLDLEGRPAVALRAVQLRRQIAAGDRDGGWRGEFQFRPQEHGLKHRRALLIADQHVGGAQRETVHAPRQRNPEVVKARTAQVLNGGRKTGGDDFNGHGVPPSAWHWCRRCPC